MIEQAAMLLVIFLAGYVVGNRIAAISFYKELQEYKKDMEKFRSL
jgi:hypothetical protein